MKKVLFLAVATAITSITFAQQPKNESYDAFLKRNPQAWNLHGQDSGKRIIVELKSGKKEVYDLSVDSQRLAVTEKYGMLPGAPPLPPLPDAAPPPPPPVPHMIEQAPDETEPLRALPPAPPSVHQKTLPVAEKAIPPSPPEAPRKAPHYN